MKKNIGIFVLGIIFGAGALWLSCCNESDSSGRSAELVPVTQQQAACWVNEFQTWNRSENFPMKHNYYHEDPGNCPVVLEAPAGIESWHFTRRELRNMMRLGDDGIRLYPALRKECVTVKGVKHEYDGFTLIVCPTKWDGQDYEHRIEGGEIVAWEYVDPCPNKCPKQGSLNRESLCD